MTFQTYRAGWFVLGMVVVALVGFPPGIGLAAEKSTQSASSTNDDEGKSSLTLNGKKLSVAFSRPSTEGKGYQALDKGIEEGFLWRLGKNKATTFETEADLKFGDVEVKAGKYSLAAKKTKDGWDLLVHPEWDRWGSPVPKEGYVATIPLKMGKAKEAAEKLTIDLKEKDGEGHFMLTWGPDTLSTTFKVAG